MEQKEGVTYTKLTTKLLEEIVAEVFSKVPEGNDGNTIMLSTGHGGAIESIKAFCTAWGWEINWKNFRRMHRFMVTNGMLTKSGGSYQIK